MELDLYKQLFNLQDAVFSRIDHEDAMVAVVYKITKPNGDRFVLKICARMGDYLREVYFLERFSGRLPVPHVVQVIKPENGIHGAILMEYLSGDLLQIADFTNELAYEIGACLAKIHLNREKSYGDLTDPDHLSSDPRSYYTSKFEEGLNECRDHLPHTLIERCQRYYDTHVTLLTSVDGPCVIHRDFRPGNLIVYQGKLRGIIDWAGGRSSFAEEDFCSMEHGEWPNNSKKSFLAGYASIRPIPDYHKLMPFLRLGKAIATLGFTVKQGTWASKHARIYQFNRQFLETFLQKM